MKIESDGWFGEKILMEFRLNSEIDEENVKDW